MKTLTLKQLTDWKPCDGWTEDFEKTFGKKASMVAVEQELLKREDFLAANWLIGKRLERLSKRKVCAFAYLCSHRALKYARQEDIAVLKKASSFARVFALTGKVDVKAARSAAASAAASASYASYAASYAAYASAASSAYAAYAASSAAYAAYAASSAAYAARSAEYHWQFKQLARI